MSAPPETPREALLTAAQALRDGAPERAEPLLREALDGELSEALRGRVLGLHAQALLGIGDAEAARDQVRAAMRAARALGDDQGLLQLRALNGQVYAQLAHEQEQARLRAAEAEALQRPLEVLLAEACGAQEQAMVYLRKANQLLDDAGDPTQARAWAEQARALARGLDGAIKEQVLSELSLARTEPTPAARRARYDAALDIADRADEANLVTAIARAAEADGLPFAPRVFGEPAG